MKVRKFSAHPTAVIESDEIGNGTRIWAFVHILKGAKIGRNCNIGDHAFIETGATIGDRVTVKNGVMIWDGVSIGNDVFVGPNVVFTNDRIPRSPRSQFVAQRYRTKNWLTRTKIREGASIGANATILSGILIGRFALVGAGAVVTRSVPPHAVVIGNPSKIAGWVSKTGARLYFDQRGIATCPDTKTRWRLYNGRIVSIPT